MKKIIALLVVLLNCVLLFAQNLHVIPAVKDFKPAKGSFKPDAKTAVKFPDSFKNEGEAFIQMVKNAYGITLISNNSATENVIEIENQLPIDGLPAGNDFYRIATDEKKVFVGGINSAGTFRGLMTLLQLMNEKDGVPCGNISDQEKNYNWRGMHLDVSRHFFPKDFIKKYIDLIALYKMNTFHWHLTDDQGWRIEIKKYPKLTQVGSKRKGSMVGHYNKQRFDTITYGGFYTQEDIKEIIAYAAARQITVVPEIEMPGHSMAALAAYPQLACKDSTFTVAKKWGVFEDVYCTKDETFKFLEDVLTEVCALFPSKYIHIGGDECPKERWKQCAKCQSRIKAEGLKDEHELQSYFIRRIEKFVNTKGKQIIGWDEILEGGLAPNAAVMSWRGTEGGEAAAKQSHPVVMSPGSHCYFDHYQAQAEYEPTAIGGFTTVQKVYSYDPTPEFLSPEKQKYIMGAQGNVWTEYINQPKDVEYMALPRMCALAEVLWNKKEDRTWEDFTTRLSHHFSLLDKLKINYSKTLYDVMYATKQKTGKDGYEVVLSTQLKGSIRYTTDGKEPDYKSSEYTTPFSFAQTTTVKAALFIDGKKAGRTMTKEFIISLASGRKVDFQKKPSDYYNKDAHFALVNGVLESQSLKRENCIGWCNDAANVTIDLGEMKTVKKVTLYVLQDGINFIVKPKSMSVFCSADDGKFDMLGKTKLSYYGEDYVKVEVTFDEVQTRYIKLRADNPGKITAGTVAHNQDLWLLLDEVVIE